MPIASMIVSSAPGADTAILRRQLGSIEGVEIMHHCDEKFVLLAETPTRDQDEALWARLNGIESVGKVELVYYNFEDLGE